MTTTIQGRDAVQLKVATANLNQTVNNFTRNIPNIKAAIDEAVKDGADVLCLQELGLTGYSGDDNFRWINSNRQQREILAQVKEIADYAKEQNPSLVVSLGFPFFYADKSQNPRINTGTDAEPRMERNPLYNINNRPFNAQAFISGGKIHGLSLKSIQPDGAAEYESRQFQSWPDYWDTQTLNMIPEGRDDKELAATTAMYESLFDKAADGSLKVQAGNVVAQIDMGDGKVANLYHEICADGWPGIYDDQTVNEREVYSARYLNYIKQDLSLVINPSASKPEPFLDKPTLRGTLATLGSKIAKGAGYIYTNCLGLEAAPAAFEGGSIFVEDGEVSHKSKRYSMMDVEYASKMMSVPTPSVGSPDATVKIAHQIDANRNKHLQTGGPDTFESKEGFDRTAEEIVRNTSLWLRDYLKKTGLQGFVISLSGGADSAFGAVMINQMIELNIKEFEDRYGDKTKAVDAFIDQFPRLGYKDEAKRINHAQGSDAAIDFIKQNMLTCIYLPSDNSGEVTLNAARTLIEGGKIDGVEHKGIGGKFEILNVQATVDSYIEAYAGIAHKDLKGETVKIPVDGGGVEEVNLELEMRSQIKEFVKGERTDLSDEVKDALVQLTNFQEDRLLTWANPKDDITLQNIQARARLPYPWMVGNQEHKIACVTSNWSEAVAGYWTFGGDGHMGAINICGGVPKSVLRKILNTLEHDGIEGLDNIKVLNSINVQTPTAELRPVKPGEEAQTDEADMMPYKQLDAIGMAIFYEKKSPEQAYEDLRVAFDNDEGQPLFSSDEELIGCIDKAVGMWHRSQFKRVGSVISPFMGPNVDPHTAIRTTILSDGFQTGLAALKVRYLAEKLGDDFSKDTGFDANRLRIESSYQLPLRNLVNYTPIDELADKLKDYDPNKAVFDDIHIGGAPMGI